MPNFQGIEDFVSAITGGNASQQAARDLSFNRLVKQRSAQVSLDRQLEQLTKDKDINANRGNISRLIEDELVRAVTLGGTGVGANLLAAEKSRGAATRSDASALSLEAIKKALKGGGELPTDLVNALTGVSSGALLAPTNVQVQKQATSDISASDALAALNEGKLNDLLPAQVDAEKALTGQRNAAAARSANPLSSGRLNLENLTADQIGLLGGQEIDVESDNPIARYIGVGGSKGRSPDFFPEFMKFQTENAVLDPRFQDSTFALTKFLESKNGSGAVVAGAGNAPASPTGSVAKFVRDANGNLVFIQ